MRIAWLFILLLAITSLLAGYCWQSQCPTDIAGFSEIKFLPQSLAQWLVNNKTAELFLPPPLRGPIDITPSQLNINQILAATNEHRQQAGLPSLTMNDTLNLVASKKADDMFAKQYFDHISPAGIGPAELIAASGYDYILSGENLALGNYRAEQDLVQAWMDSPGHRANILKGGFTEIGVSAVIGQFEGRETLISVQTFATPASACDSPDAKLQSQFDHQYNEAFALNSQLATQREELDVKKKELALLAEKIRQLNAEGNAKLKAGNEKIREGNQIAEETGSEEEARKYWEEGEALQEEGHAQQDQALELQKTYETNRTELEKITAAFNERIKGLNELSNALQETTDQLNLQIRQYNSCLEELK